MRNILAEMFDAAVAAADPLAAMAGRLPPPPAGRTVVIGAGKGAAQMAQAFETLWAGPLSGVVVTRYGYGAACKHIEVLEAAHPVPDRAGLEAAEALMAAVRDLAPDDLVVALICGGGSALLPAPAQGLALDDEIAVNRALLASGAPISAMNAVRKQVSRVKGGRLAAMTRAQVYSLIVSDIPGDDPALVSSGPTLADGSTRADALAIIRNHGIALPDKVLHHLATAPEDAPLPGDPRLAGHSHALIASARISLAAAAEVARKHGFTPHVLSDAIEGEAAVAGQLHGAIARNVVLRGEPFNRPCAILSGGETTVTVRGSGRGGRNSEFLLGLAGPLAGLEGVAALAADTDGIDGTEDNAGAFVDGTTILRLRQKGLTLADVLSRNDAWTAFNLLGDLFNTGPTGTNVNDFRAVLLE
jgi:hydroxypyruvate reductase